MDTDPCELEVLKKKRKNTRTKNQNNQTKKKLIPVLSFNEFFLQNGLIYDCPHCPLELMFKALF